MQPGSRANLDKSELQNTLSHNNLFNNTQDGSLANLSVEHDDHNMTHNDVIIKDSNLMANGNRAELSPNSGHAKRVLEDVSTKLPTASVNTSQFGQAQHLYQNAENSEEIPFHATKYSQAAAKKAGQKRFASQPRGPLGNSVVLQSTGSANPYKPPKGKKKKQGGALLPALPNIRAKHPPAWNITGR